MRCAVDAVLDRSTPPCYCCCCSRCSRLIADDSPCRAREAGPSDTSTRQPRSTGGVEHNRYQQHLGCPPPPPRRALSLSPCSVSASASRVPRGAPAARSSSRRLCRDTLVGGACSLAACRPRRRSWSSRRSSASALQQKRRVSRRHSKGMQRHQRGTSTHGLARAPAAAAASSVRARRPLAHLAIGCAWPGSPSSSSAHHMHH